MRIANFKIGAALWFAGPIHGQGTQGAGAIGHGAAGQFINTGKARGLCIAHKAGAKFTDSGGGA